MTFVKGKQPFMLPRITHQTPKLTCSAEKAVNDRLAHLPELYLLALAQFAIAADTEVVCVPFNSLFAIRYAQILFISDALFFSRPSSPLALPPFSLCLCPQRFSPHISWFIRSRLRSHSAPSYSIRPPLQRHSRQAGAHIASFVGARTGQGCQA